MDLGWWKCDVPFQENAFGFLYRITRLSTGEYYVGIKQLNNKVTRKPLKGKKRNRISSKCSDWRTYAGSGVISDEVKQQPYNFSLEIISFHNSKRDLKYAEAKYLISNGSLFDLKCYNQLLNCRLRFAKS